MPRYSAVWRSTRNVGPVRRVAVKDLHRSLDEPPSSSRRRTMYEHVQAGSSDRQQGGSFARWMEDG